MLSLVIAILVPVAFAIIGAVLAGDGLKTWYPTLAKPRLSVPIPLFAAVGLLYALMCMAILYRLLADTPEGPARALALVVLLAMMAANEAWNHLLFGRRDLRASYLGMLGYVALALVLFGLLLVADPLSALLLLPYLAWLAIDVVWIRGLWLANREPGAG